MAAPQIGEGTKVTLDLKTIGIIIGGVVSLASMYFIMQADIALAKELPKPELKPEGFIKKDFYGNPMTDRGFRA